MKRKKGRPGIFRSGLRGRPKKIFHCQKKDKEESTTTDEENQENVEEKIETESPSDEYNTPNEDQEEEFHGFLAVDKDPKNIKEVSYNEHKKEWEDAILNELKAHYKNETWEIVPKPKNVKVIGCRWVFTSKYDPEGNLVRRKARLVAKGFAQTPGVDFQETYAPVAKQRSIRIIIALAARWNLRLHQFDITTAYLNGYLKETIYMKLPDYYEKLNNEELPKNKVCKLKKAIYGLKQSGRVWYEKLDQYFQEIGFKRMESEPCIYMYENNEDKILIAIYVDDIIIATNESKNIIWFKEKLTKKFEVKDIGKLQHFLGIEFSSLSDGSIILTQRKFIQKILNKFGMEDCNTTKTPMDASTKITKEMCAKSFDEQQQLHKIPYQNLIGSLLYLAVTTRPDIAYAVSILSQYNNNFGHAHWTAAKRVVRYLKQTINFGLCYSKTNEDLKGYADADWASNSDDRKSYTGYVYMLSGGPISWEVRKQRTTALSSAEAEYMALTEATKEAIYLKNLLSELKYRDNIPVLILNDNKSAQLMANNPTINNRSKHIDIRYHFIRDAINEGHILLNYLNTDSMPADILTKPLGKNKFEKCLHDLSIKTYSTDVEEDDMLE